MRFLEKVAIVTGGASGIGEAIPHKLASQGAMVFIADLPDSAAQEVSTSIQKHGGIAAHLFCDVSEEDGAKTCVDQCIAHFGRLNLLMSNAGVFPAMGEVDT